MDGRSALLVSEQTGFVAKEAMKTAGRRTSNRWAGVSSNRADGAAGQNTSRSIRWAAKQEKFRPMPECFFLTSPFIERPFCFVGFGTDRLRCEEAMKTA